MLPPISYYLFCDEDVIPNKDHFWNGYVKEQASWTALQVVATQGNIIPGSDITTFLYNPLRLGWRMKITETKSGTNL